MGAGIKKPVDIIVCASGDGHQGYVYSSLYSSVEKLKESLLEMETVLKGEDLSKADINSINAISEENVNGLLVSFESENWHELSVCEYVP